MDGEVPGAAASTFCRGLRATFRAIRALERGGWRGTAGRTEVLSAAPAAVLFASAALGGQSRRAACVGFADSMAILRRAGIPVAPYLILPEGVEPDADLAASWADRLVVKLADVPHRTELGAVRLGVTPADVAAAVRELRLIAAAHSAPGTVVVQQMLDARGEAFIGIQGDSDLGPLVLFGRGGILLELAATGGRAAAAARPGRRPFAGGRGRGRSRRYPGPAGLAARSAGGGRRGAWPVPGRQRRRGSRSADINPLVITADGVVAVDALFRGPRS